MILNICDSPDVLSVMSVVKTFINIIRISVPIILIVVCMIDFVKSMISGEGATFTVFSKRIIAAAIIFVLPLIVSFIVKVADTNIEYYGCIDNANSEYINVLYANQASALVQTAKTTLNSGAYTSAKVAVDNLKDENAKNKLKKELDIVKAEMDEEKRIKEEEKKKQEASTIDELKALLERINNQRKRISEIIRNGLTGGGGSAGSVNAGDYIKIESLNGKYTKEQIQQMSEAQVKSMSKEEFFDFIGCAAQIVYNECGGVLPSITIAQASLESGYGKSFIDNTYNVYGLIGYPGNKPKIGSLRQFDNFYESTYYHTQYFFTYSSVYNNFLNNCKSNNPIAAAGSLSAYANGSQTYPGKIQSIINTYNLTRYDPQ